MTLRARFGPLALAVAATLILVLWMANGTVRTSQDDRADVWDETETRPSRVQVETLKGELFSPEVVLQGQIQPWQTVIVRAQVTGTVEEITASLGDQVSEGDTLLRLSDEARSEELEQSRAQLAQAEKDLEAAKELESREFVSRQEILGLRSEVASARAAYAHARNAVNYSQPKAPFDGVVNHREVEKGDFIQPGEALMEVVDNHRLKVTGQVPQQKVDDLELGQSVQVQLLNGRRLTGELTFIGAVADQDTRTFRIEAQVSNPDAMRISGGSATLRVGLDPVLAVAISPAYLSLTGDGRLSVKYVDRDDIVQEKEVNLLSADTERAWIDGLPLGTRLITQGAGFVEVGDEVDPIDTGVRDEE